MKPSITPLGRSGVPSSAKLALRRVIQLAVLGLVFLLPFLHLYATARAQGDRDALLEVPLWRLFSSLLHPLGDPEILARSIQGIPGWSLSLGPLSIGDPLLVLTPPAWGVPLLISLLLPVGLTLLVGRYFCGWICPTGFLSEVLWGMRRRLVAMGIRLPEWRLGSGWRYGLLALGAAYAALTGISIFPWIYPPAILGREVFTAIAWSQAGVGLLFLMGLGAAELLAAPRAWCRSLCPGGALYALISRFRLLRIRRQASACISCSRCVQVCPFDQNPMADRIGPDCAACGACVIQCPRQALAFSLPIHKEAS
ncbi:putative electron transport protein YccM [compost metagenome]